MNDKPISRFLPTMFYFLSPVLLFCFVLSSVGATSNLQHKIYKYQHLYKAHADAQRLHNGLLSASPNAGLNTVNNLLSSTDTIGFQIYTNDTLPTNPAPSAACATALTFSLSCNATIQYMSYAFDVGSLAAMCTPTCSSSLRSYRNQVASACNGFSFSGINNSTYNG